MPILAVAVIASVAVVTSPASTAEAAPTEIRRSDVGLLGPITVLGDSVLLGSAITSPTLADRLVEQGWGPVRMRAGEGYSTGLFGVPQDFRTSGWIERWRAEGWSTRDIVINLGANDSGLCATNPQCAYDSVMHLVDAIGPGHRIWWPQITRLFTRRAEQDNWNGALIRVASERDDFFTWDWPTVMETEGYDSHDGTHLSPDSYRKRSARMAQQITDDLARAERTGNDVDLPAAIGHPTGYIPIQPVRVADTRQSRPAPLTAEAIVPVDLTGHVPPGTRAVAVNLTAAGPAEAGYLTASACGSRPPDASSVNFDVLTTRAAMAVIPVAADGRLCVFTSAESHVLVDLQGAFVGTGGDATPAYLTAVEPPQRLVDTRVTGRHEVVQVPVPDAASAVSVNLTAVGAGESGYLTAYPCRDVPDVSNVNFGPSEAVAGSAFVPVGDEGTICVSSSTSVDVVIDITGTFADDGDLSFVPAAPTRMIDTRSGAGGWAPIQGRDQTIDALVAPRGAAAVTGTITMAGPAQPGFSTAFGCGDAPETSSVNADAGVAMANGMTTGVSADGRLCVTTSVASQTLFDTTGWWVPAPTAAAAGVQGLAAGPLGDRPENIPSEQRVYMVADSVGLGTRGHFHRAFPAGWQAVVDGTPAMFVEQLEARYVRGAPQSLIGDYGVVAGGYNYPHWDPDRFDRSIDSIIAAFVERGAKHVFWVTLRDVKPQYITPGAWNQVQPYSWYFPTVNAHLERALERHPNLTLVDWAAHADQPGLTYDAIHLNATGADLYSSLVREKIDSVTQRAPAGTELRIPIPDGAGLTTADTAAVSLNLTTTLPRTTGFLTAYPCGGVPPEVSNHNHGRDQTLAAAAVVPVPGPEAGEDAGTVCVYTHTDTNVVVDITGRFPTDAGLAPVAPRRLVDTRASGPGSPHPAGEPLRVQVTGIPGVPEHATAVVLNVTAVGAATPGFVTVAPCGTPMPPTSNVNYGTGAATPNVVVTAAGTSDTGAGDDGFVCVVASSDTDLIVDVFASFDAGAEIELVTPERFFDSRARGTPVAAESSEIIDVTAAVGIPGDAAGVLLNVTATVPAAAGYLSVFPCASGRPDASNLNMVAGGDVANFALVQPDADGRVCVYSSADTHVIVDVLGWAGSTFVGNAPERLLDTRH